MLKLLSLSAAASAAILAMVAFAPSADAYRGGHYHFSRGGHGGHSHFNRGGRYGGRHVRGNFGHRYRWGHGYGRYGWHGGHWRWGSYGGGVYYGGGYPVGGYPVGGYAAAAPAAPVCTCLGKEYLQDGSVRFFDRCTKEEAVGQAAPHN